MPRRCAVCWLDKSTGRRGTNETTWICPSCRKRPGNRDWRSSPIDEYGVTDVDLFAAMEALPIDAGPGRYETAAAIEVVKLYVWDVGTMAVIADMAGVSKSWAYEVVQHWNDHHGSTVRELREFFQRQFPRKVGT